MSSLPRITEDGATGRRGPAKVLFLHPSDELYGSDLVLLNLLRGLDRTRFSPLVVLANDLPYQGDLSRELAASDIAYRHLPIAVARRKYFSPMGLLDFRRTLSRSVRMISQLILDEHIDVVHSNTLAVWTGALAASRTKRPHIWHVHEQIERPRLLPYFMRRFVPAYATSVVSVSQAGIDHLLVTPQARAKGVVLHNGLSADEWMHATGRERIRAELGCQPDDVLVGMVARISSFKAPDLFVEAANRLLAASPQVRCFIAGGPVPGQTAMLDRVRELVAVSPAPDRIRLLGYRKDAPDIMAGLDILVQPSRNPEQCSMTILQAMFAGKPVVATDVGGNKELVVDDQTGVLVPREDVAALTHAIAELVHNAPLRKAMGQAGQQRAIQLFTLDRQIERFNQLLATTYAAAVS
jgi:glycosyltransferase involved in cell wall biosynthesis